MTEKQFAKYKKIQEELEPIKEFLFWCGNRYHNNCVGKYHFKIGTYRKHFALKRIGLAGGVVADDTFEMPYELQNRIVEVIEQYCDEKQKELDEI
jgi:hypothetical protein